LSNQELDIAHSVESYDLWRKLKKIDVLYLAILLFDQVHSPNSFKVLRYLVESAKEKATGNPSIPHRFLTELEEDMLRSIIAGDSFEEFIAHRH